MGGGRPQGDGRFVALQLRGGVKEFAPMVGVQLHGVELHDGAMGVLDMQAEDITASWDPSAKGYRSRTTVPFGHALHVPAPFDFDLDTSGFVAPAKEGGQGETDRPGRPGAGAGDGADGP
ncbi:hypothetical protein [Streptomyces sp. NBC_01483]|uniref:hypothetical protein n=1 Tax=Streptomyces sp. NBC_01483 TaxID=2903883 RepID=UPI003FCD6F84